MVHMTNGTLGFVNETTYGIRIEENGAAATTATWLLGDYIGDFPIPIERQAFIDKGSFTSFDYNELKSGSKDVSFTVPYLLMEAHCIRFALGGTNTEAGSDNAYTHIMYGVVPANAVVLPSRTFHIQAEAFTTDKFWDISGVVTQQLDLGGTAKDPAIKVKEKFMAQRITDEGGSQSLTGEVLDAAIDYSAAPEYMDSQLTTEDYYYLEHIKVNFAGAGDTNITPDIVTWNLRITNEFVPRRSSSTDEDNYGRSMNNYVGAYYVKSRRYELILNVYPTDNTIKLMNSHTDLVTDNAVNIKFSRVKATGGASNTIIFDFDNNPAVCPVTDVTAFSNFALANDQSWTFILQPKTLVTCTATDDIQDYDVVPT